MQVLIQKQR